MTNHTDTPRPAPASRAVPRAAALLGTTTLLASAAPLAAAVFALTPWSPTAMVPAAASSVRHTGAALNAGAQSHTTVLFSAIGAGKFPKEGGD
jgi:hypothetical protein